MQERTNILCYGCSPETLERIEVALPNPMLYIAPTDCATDLIAVPCLMAIIDPRALSDEDAQMLCDVYQELPDDMPRLVSPWPALEKNKSLVLPEEPKALSYLLLDRMHAHKKSRHTYGGLSDLLIVLKKLQQHPGITTKELANVLERSDRTIQRYISTLAQAGELISYDSVKRGWSLVTGRSELIDDAMHEHERFFRVEIATPTPEIAFISSLQKNYWDWNRWYAHAVRCFHCCLQPMHAMNWFGIPLPRSSRPSQSAKHGTLLGSICLAL